MLLVLTDESLGQSRPDYIIHVIDSIYHSIIQRMYRLIDTHHAGLGGQAHATKKADKMVTEDRSKSDSVRN